VPATEPSGRPADAMGGTMSRTRRWLAVGAVIVSAVVAVSLQGRSSQAAGGMIGPRSRLCFTVAGSPGDVAVVNITPVLAPAGGDGLLVSSDITNPPVASNVNYGPGSVDPNVATAIIGTDGKVCYVNSHHTNVHVIADHLGTISATTFTPATTTGAPKRVADTRPATPPLRPARHRPCRPRRCRPATATPPTQPSASHRRRRI
jgi:hypothetical protein